MMDGEFAVRLEKNWWKNPGCTVRDTQAMERVAAGQSIPECADPKRTDRCSPEERRWETKKDSWGEQKVDLWKQEWKGR